MKQTVQQAFSEILNRLNTLESPELTPTDIAKFEELINSQAVISTDAVDGTNGTPSQPAEEQPHVHVSQWQKQSEGGNYTATDPTSAAQTQWGGSDGSISNYVDDWKLVENLKANPPKTHKLMELHAPAEKQSFKPQCSEDHIYILLVSGQSTKGFNAYIDDFYSTYLEQTDERQPNAIQFTFDHGEGLFTSIAKYEKRTGKHVMTKSFLEIHNNKDADGNIYPRAYANGLITGEQGEALVDTGYSSSRGPMCILGDSIYLYNGTAYHTAIFKINKHNFELEAVYEIKDGLTRS